jgi:hypothetical protein
LFSNLNEGAAPKARGPQPKKERTKILNLFIMTSYKATI